MLVVAVVVIGALVLLVVLMRGEADYDEGEPPGPPDEQAPGDGRD